MIDQNMLFVSHPAACFYSFRFDLRELMLLQASTYNGKHISFRKFLRGYSQHLENESIQLGTTGVAEEKKG